jgi:hypothetical protein
VIGGRNRISVKQLIYVCCDDDGARVAEHAEQDLADDDDTCSPPDGGGHCPSRFAASVPRFAVGVLANNQA